MGGYGSGRWGYGQSKLTVEDCLSLSLSSLARDKLLAPGYSGTVTRRNTARGKLHPESVLRSKVVSTMGFVSGSNTLSAGTITSGTSRKKLPYSRPTRISAGSGGGSSVRLFGTTHAVSAG